MKKIDVELWVEYHNNRRSHYTKRELSEIRACEFAMHLLVPTNYLLRMIDIEDFYNDSLTNQMTAIDELSKTFGVPHVVITVKLDELIKKMLEIPKEKILELIDLDDFLNDSPLEQTITIKHLADTFGVTQKVMTNRLEEILHESNTKTNSKRKSLSK